MFGAINVHRFLAAIFLASCIVPKALTAEPPLIVRTAQGVGIIYLFPFVALSRHDQPQGVTPAKLYSIEISRWLNEPELTGQTGDTRIHPLVSAVTTLGVDHPKNLLYGHGHIPDIEAFPDTERFFVVAADRAYYFRKRDEWLAFLRQRFGITEPKAENVETVFQILSKRA